MLKSTNMTLNDIGEVIISVGIIIYNISVVISNKQTIKMFVD